MSADTAPTAPWYKNKAVLTALAALAVAVAGAFHYNFPGWLATILSAEGVPVATQPAK